MPKVYEFGAATVGFDNPAGKVKSIIDHADKMSDLGWEFKGLLDEVSSVTVFYQREKEPLPEVVAKS